MVDGRTLSECGVNPCKDRGRAYFGESGVPGVRTTQKFPVSRLVASRNRLPRFLAPFVSMWGPSWGLRIPQLATANFGEFLFRNCLENPNGLHSEVP
jgi:hypothetical protein